MRINFVEWTKELVLDAGELLELSMEGVNEMKLLKLRTPKLLYLEINECEHLESLRVSAPGLKELTHIRDTAFIHGHACSCIFIVYCETAAVICTVRFILFLFAGDICKVQI
jgi:hypothetical protein